MACKDSVVVVDEQLCMIVEVVVGTIESISVSLLERKRRKKEERRQKRVSETYLG